MGFRNLINYKKLLSLGAAFMLAGTELVMAQDGGANATAASTGDNTAQHAGMWTSISYYVLLFLLACVAVAIVGKILRVYDLTLSMQGKKGLNWNNILGVACLVFLILGMAGVYYSFTEQGGRILLLNGAASAHGLKYDAMFWVTTIITMIVFVITQILLFSFAFGYRYNDKRKGYYYPHNNTIEKIWTIIPAIGLTILVIFGFFNWRAFTSTVDAKGERASMDIDLTGHQFAWEVRYPGKDGKLGLKNYRLISGTNKLGIDFRDKNSLDDLQADTIVLPVNRSVRLNIIAQDVIHSVYMPYFRVQMNAVPGLPTFFKFTPIITTAQMRNKLNQADFEYRLYCNKICGGSHYNMQKIVRVVSEAEFQDWIAHQKPYLTDQLKKELKMAVNNDQPKGVAQNRLALNN